MMKRRYAGILLAGLIAGIGSMQAQTTWVGDIDNNWQTDVAGDTNWTGDVIPTSTDNVLIDLDTTVNLNADGGEILSLLVGVPGTFENTILNVSGTAAALTVLGETGVAIGDLYSGQISVLNGDFITDSLVIGSGTGAGGLVELDSTGTKAPSLTVNGATRLGLGASIGTLDIDGTSGPGPAIFSGDSLFVAEGETSSGFVYFNSADVDLSSFSQIGVGGFASAEAIGSSLTTKQILLGLNEGSQGYLLTLGTTLDIDGELRVGFDGFGDVNFSSNTTVTVTTGSGPSIIVGEGTGQGRLLLEAPGDAGSTLQTDQQILVGLNSKGEFTVGEHASAYSKPGVSPTGSALIVGVNEGIEGILTIDQGNYRAGDSDVVEGDVVIGFNGTGTANILNGGRLEANNLLVGRNADSYGEVAITEEFSEARLTGSVYIGGSGTASGGTGTVTVLEQAHLIVGDTVVLWNEAATLDVFDNVEGNHGAVGIGLVDELDLVDGQIRVFEDGTLQGVGFVEGDVFVESGGVVAPGLSPGILTVTGDVTLELGGMLAIELAGLVPATEFDQLIVNEFSSVGGIIDVSLINSFAPVLNDSFQIVQGTSFSLSSIGFDFTDAALGAGLSWDVSQFGVNGTITVVPEPSSAALVILGGALALMRRRRSAAGL